MTVFGSEILFSGLDASGHAQLWETNGTAAGTQEVPVPTANVAATGLAPSDMTVFNGEVLFSGFDVHNRPELWVTDGTGAGTQALAVAGTIPAQGLRPSNLEVYNGQVLFSGLSEHVSGTTMTAYQGLWTTDGTAAGTHEVVPISGTRSLGLFPADLTTLTVTRAVSDFTGDGTSDIVLQNGGPSSTGL